MDYYLARHYSSNLHEKCMNLTLILCVYKQKTNSSKSSPFTKEKLEEWDLKFYYYWLETGLSLVTLIIYTQNQQFIQADALSKYMHAWRK